MQWMQIDATTKRISRSTVVQIQTARKPPSYTKVLTSMRGKKIRVATPKEMRTIEDSPMAIE